MGNMGNLVGGEAGMETEFHGTQLLNMVFEIVFHECIWYPALETGFEN